jgi:LmbE family N-acetylglucosaminyl deacetylase
MSGVVVFSPHPDDAVLSLGPYIAGERRRGIAVTVVTVFSRGGRPGPGRAQDEPADRAWAGRYLDGRRRAREDRDACRALGARHLAQGQTDAAARRDARGAAIYAAEAALRRAPPPADEPHRAAAHAAMDRLTQRLPGRLFFPLGIGGHVDHGIVAGYLAARPRLWERAWLYEDLPYAVVDPGDAGRRRREMADAGWRAEFLAVEEADVQAGIAAALAYRSQIAALFPSPTSAAAVIRSHLLRCASDAGAVGGWAIRCWRHLGRDGSEPRC